MCHTLVAPYHLITRNDATALTAPSASLNKMSHILRRILTAVGVIAIIQGVPEVFSTFQVLISAKF